jgi:ATP-dependent DNA ligase
MLERRRKKPLPKSKRQYVHVFDAAVEASKLKQALRAPFTKFIEPALATLVDKPPSSAEWLHEIKFDGYRLSYTFGRSNPRCTRDGATTGRSVSSQLVRLHGG